MFTLRNRDEREVLVDHAADRLAFLVLCYGALGIAAYRSLVLQQAAWDLLVLVIAGGIVGLGYRVWQGAATRSWSVPTVAAVVVAALVATGLALLGLVNR